MKILLVDDNPEIRWTLKVYLENSGCTVIEASNGREGMDMVKKQNPDIIVSDVLMPEMDGFQFLKEIKEDSDLHRIPFIFYSSIFNEEKEKNLARKLGATGYIIQPKTPEEFFNELKEILSSNTEYQKSFPSLHIEDREYIRDYSQIIISKLENKIKELEITIKEKTRIEEKLKKALEESKKKEESLKKSKIAFMNMLEDLNIAYKELHKAYDETIEGWSRALDFRDKETEGHSQRVTEMTLKIAKNMGFNSEELVYIKWGALLHDIGKLGVPDSILFKADRLNEEEWKIMKTHPVIAYELLWPVEFLRKAIDIPYCHHEKWDGSGYPRGLKGNSIPLPARIFAIIDVWDALLSQRPYRPAWEKERVIDYIISLKEKDFDPEVVDIFIDILAEDKP